MCGIIGVWGGHNQELVQKMGKKLEHRGPDEVGIFNNNKGHILCHQRLSIIDLHSGKQPIFGKNDACIVHNGEIYNHKKIKEKLKADFKTNSDSEAILKLYEEVGVDCLHELDGVFAFIISDGKQFFVARDPIGVKPLFYGIDKDGAMWFASEYKALIEVCSKIEELLPGHYFTPETGFVKWYTPAWQLGEKRDEDGSKIRKSLTEAVEKRLMSDVDIGVLLSGGLDSSLITSIVAKAMKKQGKKTQSFSVGISKDSTDLKKAREVSDFLGTEHHEILFTPKNGIEVIEELIYKIESYDVTTIRASTPMYLMAKYIKKLGVKVVLSGEGADEMFGGYLYFENAPNADEFHKECLRRVKRLHTSDVLRVDRSMMGQSIEARVPFLDKQFLKDVMSIDPELKTINRAHGRIEKHILRKAFDTPNDPYLPDSVLWRQKEQFSDGVGYSWVDALKELAENLISDEEFAMALKKYPHNTPSTKEAMLYRNIYAAKFGRSDTCKLVKKWIPLWQEDKDPSGRANNSHSETYCYAPLKRSS